MSHPSRCRYDFNNLSSTVFIVAGLLKSEMPWTITLAVSGITLQLYTSYMLLTSRNSFVIKPPFMSKYKPSTSCIIVFITGDAVTSDVTR